MHGGLDPPPSRGPPDRSSAESTRFCKMKENEDQHADRGIHQQVHEINEICGHGNS